ncbi:MAG: hypothetical protein HF973_08375 [Chloroflexi bacterium]|nr:hypothetical protein [Chloroflexota bacterium]
MKKIILITLLLFSFITACGQKESPPLPTAAAAATLPPLPEGANAVIVVEEEAPVTEPDTAVSSTTSLPTAVPQTITIQPTQFAYTYQQPDGNRIVFGQGNLPNLTPLDIPLGGTPQWVTALPLGEAVMWGVVLEDGRTQAFLVENGAATEVAATELMPNVAPVMTVSEDWQQAGFLNPPVAEAGGNSPVVYDDAGNLAYSNAAGELFLLNVRDGNIVQVDAEILPDGRLLFDENGRLLILSDPTGRYDHGVLGDALEGGGVILVETGGAEPTIATHIVIPEPQVIEGIMPLWVDWDGDGQREIIVTLSDANQGAQIVLYSEDGEQLAAGEPIGRGQRWRHQIAVAPFGPNGEMELATVLTPHIGGTVGFYQWEGDQLNIVAELSGYTSHVINSRSLDMAMAGDFNGDGRPELLLPTDDRTQLGGIQRTADGAEAAYQLDLPGQMATNLAGATLVSGDTAVGVGLDNGVLRVWQP